MTRKLIIQRLAEDDITRAAVWYQEQQTGLGIEFLAEIDTALEMAVAHPRRFPSLRRRPDVRRILIRRFPYRVFFVLRPDAIAIFRVLHGARDEREWKEKMPTK